MISVCIYCGNNKKKALEASPACARSPDSNKDMIHSIILSYSETEPYLNFMSLEELEARVKQAQELMSEASKQVLGGFALTTDADIYRYPERYRDEERGGAFWDKVMGLLPENLLPTD